MTRRRNPHFCQHPWIFDRHLINQIVFARAVEALDYVFLITVEPAGEVIPSAYVNGDDIYYQRIPFPVANGIAVECWVRVLRMRPAVYWHDTEIVIEFVQLYQLIS